MPKLIAEAGGEALEQQLVKARELYKQEKYQAALFTYNKVSPFITNLICSMAYFSEAIQIRAAILPSKAFDGRAAVHIKLRDYPAALKDAKQTIHSAKNEAKVGLRKAREPFQSIDKKLLGLPSNGASATTDGEGRGGYEDLPVRT